MKLYSNKMFKEIWCFGVLYCFIAGTITGTLGGIKKNDNPYFKVEDNTVKKNIITKIAYQENILEPVNIELATLTLYFDRKPLVNCIPTLTTQKSFELSSQQELPRVDQLRQEAVYFFPLSSVPHGEVKKSFDLLNAVKNKYYSLRIDQVSAPVAGVKLTITYNSDQVQVGHDILQTYDRVYCVVFRIYSRGLLDAIEKKEQALLMVI